MANNPINKHRGHPKRITFLNPQGTGPGQHYARMDCVLCREFVKWVSKDESKNHQEKQ